MASWRLGMIAGLSAWLAGAASGPAIGEDRPPPEAIGPAGRAALERYARDTWRSFEAMTMPGGLPADALLRDPAGAWAPARATSPTDIGAYLWSVLAAETLDLIGAAEADGRLGRALEAVGRLERSHGFFYNWYDSRDGDRPSARPGDPGSPAPRPFLSTVDNGWLAAALMMVGNARPGLRARAEALLGPMDFRFFFAPYDPSDPLARPGQFRGGWYADDATFTRHFYRLVNTEPRIASYVAIARGQVPPAHYYRLERTPPTSRVRQTREPRGEARRYLDIPVFEGHYTYRDMDIVPSWGGSMFEALMVPLFVPESRWAPRSWGVNHDLYVRAQIELGLEEKGYGFWGFSPACKPEGGYGAYGVDELGAAPDGYHPHDAGPPAGGVVTPHALFLALRFAPREALAGLAALEAKFPIYGRFGFRDSVNVATGAVADRVLSLDQGMILAAIANALSDDAMQHAFSDGPVEAAIRPLIAPEEFTAGVAASPPAESPAGRPVAARVGPAGSPGP